MDGIERHNMKLELVLYVVAIAQLAVAVVNLFLVRLLGWRADLERMPLLIREVFVVHAWFISVTLAIFGAVTIRFAPEFAAASHEVFRWLAAGIGAFWALRTVLQVTYYSSSHWKGRTDRTLIHVLCLAAYGGFAAAYLMAAM
jgi:hypothetical protein